MFRLTHYLREIIQPTPVAPARKPTGPVVIWNLIRRCNLSCKHCYSISGDVDFPGELTTADVLHVMDDLKAFGVPVLILSGGEPLIRRDIFAISARAKGMGFYVGLSSNGTLIDDALADRIRDTGYDYVGVSLDGIGATHDRFRGKPGAYEAALAGLRRLRHRDVKVGVRFTMTEDNAAELPDLLDLVEREGFPKFYLSHLVYAGRGNKNRQDDAAWNTTRAAMDVLITGPGPGRSADRRSRSSPATMTPMRSICCIGPPARRRPACGTCGRSSRNGAAIPPASTSPISTISAMCIPIQCGGTTRSAM